MSDPIALYDEADKLKDEGKLDEAVAKLNEALEGRPKLRAGPLGAGRGAAKARPARGSDRSTRGGCARSSRTIRSASPR